MASKSVGPLWFALWAFLVLAACRGASNADREVLRYAIPVGSTPVALAAALDGHIVVSVNISGTLSMIDVRSHREVARLDVPLLKASHDRLVHELHGETLDPIFSSADQAIMDIRV
jgi:hypothetical protein